MDPFSITVGIISVAAATIETSKALLDLIHNASNGSEELQTISRDTQAFYQLVISMNLTVQEYSLPSFLRNDDAMLAMIRNLESPLRNRQATLGQLMVKVEPRVVGKPSAHDSVS